MSIVLGATLSNVAFSELPLRMLTFVLLLTLMLLLFMLLLLFVVHEFEMEETDKVEITEEWEREEMKEGR